MHDAVSHNYSHILWAKIAINKTKQSSKLVYNPNDIPSNKSWVNKPTSKTIGANLFYNSFGLTAVFK